MSDGPAEDDDRGRSLLSRISSEMVRAQKQFFGKGPTQAKSYILDDILVVVMRGGLTTAEQTMLEFGYPGQVRQFRQLFQNEMTERLTTVVEELTGRKVATYQSQVLFDPDVMIELFVFDQPADSAARRETAEGQLDGDDTGQATDEDAFDAPSSSGR